MSDDEEAPRPKGDYEVGYKKPPKATQFKKGQSGNPKGRRKGARNFKTDLLQTLKAPVTITEAGKKRTVSTQAATLLRLREMALKGDGKSIDRFLAFAQAYNIEEPVANSSAPLAENDRAIIARALARRMAPGSAPQIAPKDAPPDAAAEASPDKSGGR